MKVYYLLLIALIPLSSFAQTKILVFHETNGFRHSGAINNGIAMFEDLGNVNGAWTVDNSQDSSVFTTANLAQYDAVVFLNTSGTDEDGNDGDLLSGSEKDAFEAFIASGKGFVGIHAATDTYRDGVWDFYNELVGGIVQTNPNHTSNNFNADIEVITSNPIVDFLGTVGSTWNKDEEYYYWEQNGGQLSTDNTVLLEVEETEGPNGMVNSYDAERPITWFKESVTYDDDNDEDTPKVTINGIRSFYTALGHNGSDYANNSNFRTLLENATLWAIGNTLDLQENSRATFKISNNLVKTSTIINLGSNSDIVNLKLYDVLGKKMLQESINPSQVSNNQYRLDLSQNNTGIYLLQLETKTQQKTFKLIKI